MEIKTIEDAIEFIKRKFNDDTVRSSIAGISKKVQFYIEDENKRFTFIVERGELKDIVTGDVNNVDIIIQLKSSTLIKIIRGESNPTREFMLGRIKVKGAIKDLLKFRKVLE